MSLSAILLDFNQSVAQCDSLIANAHRVDATGNPILPAIDQQQITVAAFLNMFMAWESFLESSITEFMTGAATIGGGTPIRYVAPPDIDTARKLMIWVGKYFDYANHQNVRKVVPMYFENGYPFEPHLSAINLDLDELRTMRNSSAHISSSTRLALEALALRIFGQPQPGITLYQLLTKIDPRSTSGDTVYLTYKNKLAVTASLISHG